MAYKIVQLSVKKLSLLVNKKHTLVLDKDEDYYALSFTLISPRAGKASINTVKTIPLQDKQILKLVAKCWFLKKNLNSMVAQK